MFRLNESTTIGSSDATRAIELINFKSPDYISLNKLSKRQIDCLYCLVQGMRIKEIAKSLSISPRTVEHYIDMVKAKLNCNSRFELIEKALKMKIIRERL